MFNVRGLAGHLGGDPARLVFTVGQVTATSAGVFTVVVFGDTQQAPYLGSAPSVGDTVAVLISDGSPVILGTLHGIPTF